MNNLKESRLFISIDIKTEGLSPQHHPLLAIGVVLAESGKSDGEVVILDRDCWCLKPFPGQIADAESAKEFRTKHAVIFDEIKTDPTEALVSFSSWLNNITKRFPDKTIAFVAVNPLFSMGFLDIVLIGRGIRTSSIRQLDDGADRPIYDPAGMQLGLGDWTAGKLAMEEVKQDHWPVNDAETAMRAYFHSRQARLRMRYTIQLHVVAVKNLIEHSKKLERYIAMLAGSLAVTIAFACALFLLAKE